MAVVMWALGVTPLEAGLVGGSALAVTGMLARVEGLAVVRALQARRWRGAKHDHTGLPASDYADHFVAMEYASARRGRQVTLVLIGFDELDEFTMTHGADASDAAVTTLGRVLQRQTRKANLSARYAWRKDTFLSVLSDADATGAESFVRRITGALADQMGSKPLPKISIGVAEFDPSMAGPEQFVERAEWALAEARADGGGCIRYRYAEQRGASERVDAA